jgi:chemotaxis protein methyltransferase CheR
MSLSTADSSFVRDLVSARAAIVLDSSKEYLIESRLATVARELGMEDATALVRELRRRPTGSLGSSVIEAMTTNETTWFRDRHPFDALRDSILPSLIAIRRPSRSLRIWCAASSSGQEPYSIAMLIHDHFPELVGWRVEILATDISERILARARTGIYNQVEMNRGLPSHALSRHFDRRDGDWELSAKVRSMVTFRQMNLASSWPFLGRFDLVMLRNVLIYFDQPTKARILESTADVLEPHGVLMLGGAETTLNVTERYQHVRQGACGWYRLADARA